LQWKEKSEDRPTGSRLVVELTKLFHTARCQVEFVSTKMGEGRSCTLSKKGTYDQYRR